MLDAIGTSVTPAYVRFANFLRAREIPAGRKEPGVWAAADGDAYYASLRPPLDHPRQDAQGDPSDRAR